MKSYRESSNIDIQIGGIKLQESNEAIGNGEESFTGEKFNKIDL